MNWLGSLKAR
jgi:hypothetical protein